MAGPIPEDLTIVTGEKLPADLNAATDVLLQEPAATGNRQLLVRVLQAKGTPMQESGTMGSPLAYVVIDHDPHDPPTIWPRLVVERANVVAPDFRILLFPMHAGDPAPVTQWDEKGGLLTVAIGQQTDHFQFYPRTAEVGGINVTLNEFTLTRADKLIFDYRNLIEPMTLR